MENLTISSFLPTNQFVVNLTILDDDVFEGKELLTVGFELFAYNEFYGDFSYATSPASTAVTIVDDEAPRKYSNEKIYSRYNS